MVEKLSGISLPVGASEEELKNIVSKKTHGRTAHFKILKKSLDARDKQKLRYVYTVEYSAQKQPKENPMADRGELKNKPKVVIVGAGPAGLFCALRLLTYGVMPVVIERGAPVEERVRDVENFINTGKLDLNSNIQFGEGGAGTFSDGKLNTQTNGKENEEVLKIFTYFGAPEEIEYLNKPHIGSDKLRALIRNVREYILGHGGTVLFHTTVKEVMLSGGVVTGVVLSNGEKIEADEVVLAIGHSARDTFQMLEEKAVAMEQKEFAVGVRIEHLQEKIGFSQYGKSYSLLPPADYKLVSHASERAAFTFCMCPGGLVMPSASEENAVVTNGMSNYLRDEKNANSALIVQVKKEDFISASPLAGIAFQRELEKRAFLLGEGAYKAPVQRVEDFLAGRKSSRCGEVVPSYSRGVTYTDLGGLFNSELTSALKNAIPDMGKRLKGFDNADAILTGVESRTSSPVRILRDERGESVNAKGLYPCGEGAGYAGGITSAAADGLRTAKRIVDKYL